MKLISNYQWTDYQELLKSFDDKVKEMEQRFHYRECDLIEKMHKRDQLSIKDYDNRDNVIEQQRNKIYDLEIKLDKLQGIKRKKVK